MLFLCFFVIFIKKFLQETANGSSFSILVSFANSYQFRWFKISSLAYLTNCYCDYDSTIFVNVFFFAKKFASFSDFTSHVSLGNICHFADFKIIANLADFTIFDVDVILGYLLNFFCKKFTYLIFLLIFK